MKLKIRKSLLTKSKQDLGCSLFLFTVIPVIFYYEVHVVFPAIHGASTLYFANLIAGTFLVFNIVGNLLSIALIDTSVFSTSQLTMTESRFKKDPTAKDWNLCAKCEIIVPPRSWHCDTCDVCVLKRDHHCMFASNCVGLKNHRHFIVFLFYFFVGTTYALIYNSYFIWVLNSHIYIKWITIVKMALPMFMLWNGTMQEIHICCYMLIAIGSALSCVLLIYHWKLIVKNNTTHEKRLGIYDLGLGANLKVIFGKKWLRTLFWPFASSPLPKIYWNVVEVGKDK